MVAIKEVKNLKVKDTFLSCTFSGVGTPHTSWAEVLAIQTLRYYDTGSMKHREIHEVEYKILSNKKNGEKHKVLLNPTDKVTVPDRPGKIRRVWKELWS